MREATQTIKHLHYDLEMEITNPDLIDRDFVLNAIKRQIPQKPAWNVTKYGESRYCPTCNQMVSGGKTPYCAECGQKLDWESEG